jgi:2-keto-4-pentenoate hydratase
MTADRPVVDALAARLLDAAANGRPIEPIRDELGAEDIEGAYAVQATCVAEWLRNGRSVVGRKIGLTNPAVQRHLGVDQPDFGFLFEDMRVRSGDHVARGWVLQPRVEAEMAFVLGTDIDDADVRIEEVAAAIAYVQPALEIVGSRIAEWQIGIVDTIADNASSGGFVLGDDRVPLTDVDLTGATMEMTRTRRDGSREIVSTGTGADCLGSPLVAAHWLGAEMVRRGSPLRSGEVILTGALGPIAPVVPGDTFEATITGLGTVSITFD